MAKYAETLIKMAQPIKREKGYMYYLSGEVKGDGQITKICRSPMKYFQKK